MHSVKYGKYCSPIYYGRATTTNHNDAHFTLTYVFLCNVAGLAGTETSRGCSVRRQRRARTLFTEDAVDRLEAVFVLDPYPDINMRENLAEDIGVSEARIQVRHPRFLCCRVINLSLNLNATCKECYRPKKEHWTTILLPLGLGPIDLCDLHT